MIDGLDPTGSGSATLALHAPTWSLVSDRFQPNVHTDSLLTYKTVDVVVAQLSHQFHFLHNIPGATEENMS